MFSRISDGRIAGFAHPLRQLEGAWRQRKPMAADDDKQVYPQTRQTEEIQPASGHKKRFPGSQASREPKEGGDLLSRIALQYHRRGQA